MRNIRLAEFCDRTLLTAYNIDPLNEVIKKMETNGINHLPVITSDGILVGIISLLDVYRKVLALSKTTGGRSYTAFSLNSFKADQIMTVDPVILSPEDSLDLAAEILMQGKFHAVPVVRNSKVVGIITSKDILEKMANSQLV